jgi:hypothetical protein
LQQKQGRLAEVRAEIETLPLRPPTPVSSGNLFLDVLRDYGSVSVHRFQVFVWTFLPGTLFLRTVARDFVMPDFDNTLLGLMGISSGTYLGFRSRHLTNPELRESRLAATL